MIEEESGKKVERILLDLNKNGLSYLTSSTPISIQISQSRLCSIWNKPKK